MQRSLGATVIAAALAAACSGKGSMPTAPSNTRPPSAAAGTSKTLGGAANDAAASAEVEGVIEAVPPTTASSTFRVAGKTVRTDPSTVFVDGSVTRSFSDLRVGLRVEAKGSLSGDTLTASRVELEEAAEEPEPEPEPQPAPAPPRQPNPPAPEPGDDDEQNEAEVTGMLGPVSGSCPAISSTVGTTRFSTSASTRFDDASCSAFKTGDRVEVKGTRNADGSIAASRLKRE
ncbi:MAG TPA: DUF5666 domain-containing protein [Vicinamibacterales bacterium]|nr:DUF5666 domain-containing protein [Vicinamibacterales bacterium]